VANKFQIGDYVRVKDSQFILTGSIVTAKDSRGQYLVLYDPHANDTSFLTEGWYYEDALDSCIPPRTTV
jgi:hypothetical protein